jgi:mono/diheme cytochrome c family protein
VAALVLALLFSCASAEPAGKALFNASGCLSCHKVNGRGGNAGPDLSLVGFRHSPEWLDQWLADPKKWKHDAKMPNFALKPDARAGLVGYLSTLKGQDWKAPASGAALFKAAGCVACHGARGKGGHPNNNVPANLIPALTDADDGFTLEELKAKISRGSTPAPQDPSAPAPLVFMPAWGQVLSPESIDAVARYVISLSTDDEKKEW